MKINPQNETKQPLEEVKSLGELIQLLIDIRKVIADLPEPMKMPEKKKAYTISQWNEHVAVHDAAFLFNQELKESEAIAREKLFKIEKAIKTMLPKAHIWFVTDDVMYAVALQENDWPGTPTEILVREMPVIEKLPELKPITSNFN